MKEKAEGAIEALLRYQRDGGDLAWWGDDIESMEPITAGLLCYLIQRGSTPREITVDRLNEARRAVDLTRLRWQYQDEGLPIPADLQARLP